MSKARSVVGLLLVGFGLIAASVGLGFWFAAVQTACEKPYRDDLGDTISGLQACTFGSPHASLVVPWFVLITLTVVVGLAGLVVLVISLVALFSKGKWQTRDERKLERLRNERLRAEGRHPDQLRAEQERRMQEQRWQAAEQQRKDAEQRQRAEREAMEQRKRQVREEIQREERLREERMRKQKS